MNSTIHRFRRWTVAGIAATALLSSGLVVGFAGTASALPTIGSISGPGAPPTILSRVVNTPNQPAGDLTLAFNPGVILTNSNTFTITTVNNTGTPLNWENVPNFTINHVTGSDNLCVDGSTTGGTCPLGPSDPNPATPPIIAGNILTIVLAAGSNAFPLDMVNGESITISNINLGVPGGTAVGPDFNTVAITAGPQAGDIIAPNVHPNLGTGSGDGTTNAIVANSASAPNINLSAVTTPAIAIGGNNQTAGSWNLLLKSAGAGTTQIAPGDSVNILIADHAKKNCDPGTLADPDTLGFAAVPSLTITAGSGSATGVPTATASLSAVSKGATVLCGGTAIDDLLTITFTGTSPITLLSTTSGINIQITGVKYNVSQGATISADQGTISAGSMYSPAGFTLVPAPPGGLGNGATPGPSNADIGAITVVGNTPPSDIQLNVTTLGSGSEAVNQPISPITLTESSAGALPAGVNGYVCVSLITGGEWDATTTAPTATATGGATVTNPIVETTGPVAGHGTMVFQVTGASSSPSTITLSNLNVSVPQNLLTDFVAGFVIVTYGGSNPVCGGGVNTTTLTKVFSVSGRIYGVDADATAVQAFGIANPVTSVGTSLAHPGSGGNLAAVLATDSDPYDALSASYLAGQVGGSVLGGGTGILLTPTSTVSSETLSALRLAGVETVYAVGGPDAISQADITTLESTPSYFPGGQVQRYDPFTNDIRDLVVQWIYGNTADDTASQVAQFVGNFPLGQPAFQGGYGGQYNDTAGSSGSPSSSAPDSGVNTAILATDTGFQDAASASVMAYHSHLPLILTPPGALSSGAIAALDNDGIQQAIVEGGNLVINDAVVTQLEGMGISVLRVAGSDYTDTSAETAKLELNDTNAAGQFDGLAYSTTSAIGIGGPGLSGADIQSLGFARGDFFTDAIVSSQIDSILQEPELLTENPTTLGTPVATFLATEGNPATAYGSTGPSGPGFSVVGYNIVGGQAIFGGPVAIASAIETTIADDIGPDQIPFP